MNYQHLPLIADDDVNQILRIDGDSQITINLEVESEYKEEYEAWVAEGNEPLPAPEPEPAPVLTTEQKLEAAGLTVAELKELFGLE